MLHAELRGKIGEEATDAQRKEDVLTSTVFGTLFTAGAWDVLAHWLGAAKAIGNNRALTPAAVAEGNYWFWPRLGDVEPDVIVQLGSVLVIVEAKYLSGKSGKGPAASSDAMELPLEDPKDQLVRQWRACAPETNIAAYPAGIRDAIRGCERALVYLVRRSHWTREHREVERSLQQAPDARMLLLTWEHLDEVLASGGLPRWAEELRAYLRRRGLTAFRGFRSAEAVAVDGVAALTGWWSHRPPVGRSLRSSFDPQDLPRLQKLAAWRLRTKARTRLQWSTVIEPRSLGRLSSLASQVARFPF